MPPTREKNLRCAYVWGLQSDGMFFVQFFFRDKRAADKGNCDFVNQHPPPLKQGCTIDSTNDTHTLSQLFHPCSPVQYSLLTLLSFSRRIRSSSTSLSCADVSNRNPPSLARCLSTASTNAGSYIYIYIYFEAFAMFVMRRPGERSPSLQAWWVD